MTKKELEKIHKLVSKFPPRIEVVVEPSEDGGFVAEIKSLPGCLTEADTFSDLIGMVNDAVYTYFSVPVKLRDRMPSYVPPVEVGQQLGLIPTRRQISWGGVTPTPELAEVKS